MSEHDAYDSIAKHYDFIISTPLRGIRRSVADLVPPEGSVIDIGCGTGEQLAMLNNGKRELVGIDASPAMLEVARKRDLKNVTLARGNGWETQYPDGHFSCALLSFVLHETDPESRNLLITEAKRLVGSTGSIVIAEYEPPKGILARFLSLGIRFVERLAGGEHYKGYRHWMGHGGLSGFCALQLLQIEDSRRHFGGNIVVAICTALSNGD